MEIALRPDVNALRRLIEQQKFWLRCQPLADYNFLLIASRQLLHFLV
jgi:hypothetical protein